MKKFIILLILTNLLQLNIAAQDFDIRKAHILDYVVFNDQDYETTDKKAKELTLYYAGMLHRGERKDYALTQLGKVMDENNWDHLDACFDAHHTMFTYCQFKDQYPTSLKDKVRQNLTTKVDYFDNGTTPNHRMMWKTAGYLAAQEWPDWEKAAQVKSHCREELMAMMNEWVHENMIEYDCPVYSSMYYGCLLSLIQHANDEELVNRARMTLEWMLAYAASEWLEGYWVTSHDRCRSHDNFSSPQNSEPAMLNLWTWFGGGTAPAMDQVDEPFYGTIPAVVDYEAPAWIEKIAHQRDITYSGLESRISRNPSVRKYHYITPTYGLATQMDGKGDLWGWPSSWAGSTTRRMNLKWISDQRASTFFVTHHHESRYLQGATIYEQMLQHEGTAVAVYNIDPDYPIDYIAAVFSQQAIQILEKTNDWIFFHGGSVMVGVRFLKPFYFEGMHDERGDLVNVYQSDHLKNGVIVESASPSDYPGLQHDQQLEAFKTDILENSRLNYVGLDIKDPSFSYTDRLGNTLEITYNGPRTVNGNLVDYESYPLIGNPWMHQELSGDTLIIIDRAQQLYYDFANWKVTSSDQLLLPPGNLVTQNVNEDSVVLVWHATQVESDYLVERKLKDGNFSHLATTSDTFLIDKSIQPHQDYIYRVRSVAGSLKSIPGNLTFASPGRISQVITNSGFQKELGMPVIFPNPGTGAISLSDTLPKKGPWEVKLWDNHGRIVSQKQFAKLPKQLNLSQHDLLPGIYLLELKNEKQRFNYKYYVK